MTDSQPATLVSPAQAEPPLVLALDIGTSSTRAMLFDRQARAVSGLAAHLPHHIEASPDGAFETDPDALLETVWQSIDEVLGKAGKQLGEIQAVCGCTFVSNVLGIDASGKAITPLVLYGDTRAAPQAADLRAHLDEEYFHQRTGARFHSSYLPARFLWWQQAKPEEFARVRRWISIGEYLLLQLFHSASASYSVASWTGLLLRARLDWDDELLEHLPVRREQLSTLVDVDHAWRGLDKEFAARWPALAQAAWYPVIGDGAAANVGSGCATPGRVAISIGTSSAVRAVVTNPGLPLPPGLWCYRVDRRRLLLGGAMTEGGSVYAWLHKTLNLQDIPDLEAALSKAISSPGQAQPGDSNNQAAGSATGGSSAAPALGGNASSSVNTRPAESNAPALGGDASEVRGSAPLSGESDKEPRTSIGKTRLAESQTGAKTRTAGLSVPVTGDSSTTESSADQNTPPPLVFLPLISGERSPGWVSEARGVITGLSIATTPLDLLRAGLEGVACRIAQVYSLLASTLGQGADGAQGTGGSNGTVVDSKGTVAGSAGTVAGSAGTVIIASGGAIQDSPAWQQILADALNQPVRLSHVPETSARGAALLALEALGAFPEPANLPDLSYVAATPDPQRRQHYQEIIRQQREIYDRLIGPNA